MDFGYKIRLLRKEKEWSQDFVAEKLNISIGALSRYENGIYEPKSLALIKDFADLFQVSTDYILGRSNIRNPEKNLKEEFTSLYSKEMEGLTPEEIADALRFYKDIKYGKKNS